MHASNSWSFFIFDSHALDENGNPDTEFGKAHVWKFQAIEAVIDFLNLQITRLASSAFPDTEIQPVVIVENSSIGHPIQSRIKNASESDLISKLLSSQLSMQTRKRKAQVEKSSNIESNLNEKFKSRVTKSGITKRNARSNPSKLKTIRKSTKESMKKARADPSKLETIQKSTKESMKKSQS